MKTFADIDYKKGPPKGVVDALWQYFLDHSEIEQNGKLRVTFHLESKKDIYKLISSRMKGIYRNDPEYKEFLMSKNRQEVLEQSQMQRELAKLKNQKPKRNWWGKFLKILNKLK